jgi:hypothetical protein
MRENIGVDLFHFFIFLIWMIVMTWIGVKFDFSEKTILWLIFSAIVGLGLEQLNNQMCEFRRVLKILEEIAKKLNTETK